MQLFVFLLIRTLGVSKVSNLTFGRANGHNRSKDFMDELNWCIWPKYDVDRIVQILDENDEYLERRHGTKLETLLHR